ncbi:MAG TPA: hypothetical protein VLY82_06405 [Nitrososphaerales archaeon]|nr:hypothetical protein [Nitrososphaerales archaeon]
MNASRLVPLVAAAALAFLYLEFGYLLVQSGLVQNATLLQQVIFLLQFVKVGAISAVGRFRNTRFVNVVNLLGAEVVVALPTLAVATVSFSSSEASTLMNQIFLAWIAGAASAATPYSIYRLARAMIRRERLLVVLPSGVVISELVLLMQAGVSSAVASGQGLLGISRTILLLGVGTVTTGVQLQGLLILVPLSIYYVAFLLHSLSPVDDATPSKFEAVTAFAVVVTALTYGGTLAASSFVFPFAYLSLIPTLVVSGLFWWLAREA